MSLGDAANQFIASVNPTEVSEQAKLLQQLNAELEKQQINPAMAFMAGTTDATLASWIVHHCPAELAWGLPAKIYVTALNACSALEPELRRFEGNLLRLFSLLPTNDKKPK
jgi:hypothetical protein